MGKRGVIIGVVIFVAGFAAGNVSINQAEAAACSVDQPTLERLYDGMFHRPLDAGAFSYVGFDLSFVIDELMKSQEHSFYGTIFNAAKKIENNQRDGDGVLADHYGELSSALGNLSTWASGVTVSAPVVGGSTGTTTEVPPEAISPRTGTVTLTKLNMTDQEAWGGVIIADLDVEVLCETSGAVQLREFAIDIVSTNSAFQTYSQADLRLPDYPGVTVTLWNDRVTFSDIELNTPNISCGTQSFRVVTDFWVEPWNTENRQAEHSTLTVALVDGSVMLYERREDVAPTDPVYYRWERILVNGS